MLRANCHSVLPEGGSQAVAVNASMVSSDLCDEWQRESYRYATFRARLERRVLHNAFKRIALSVAMNVAFDRDTTPRADRSCQRQIADPVHVLIKACESNRRRRRISERAYVAREAWAARRGLSRERRGHRKRRGGVAGGERDEWAVPSMEPASPFETLRRLHSGEGASGYSLAQRGHASREQYCLGDMCARAVESRVPSEVAGGKQSGADKKRSRAASEGEHLTRAMQRLVLLPTRFLQLRRDRLVERCDRDGGQYGHTAAEQLTLRDPGRRGIGCRSARRRSGIWRRDGRAVIRERLCLRARGRESKHTERKRDARRRFQGALPHQPMMRSGVCDSCSIDAEVAHSTMLRAAPEGCN